MSTVTDHAVDPDANEVRSSIDMDAFFRATKHLFASSDSYIGELMQNARRAGASGVRFDVDPQKRTMTVSDDGEGVRDFQALVRMCQSDWKEQVTLTDKPFGMGLFSVFHAAERVCIRSGGQKISFSIEDIVGSKALPILADPDGPARGTKIELMGVNKLDESSRMTNSLPLGRWAIGLTLRQLAKGFGIPVFVNGHEVPRPYAVANRSGGHSTPIGYVWNSQLAAGRKIKDSELFDMNDSLFLQGLPIKGGPFFRCGRTVVHLDSTQFIARMPDRTALYDEDTQLSRVKDALKAYAHQRLSEIKAAIRDGGDLSGEEGARFVSDFYAIAVESGCLSVFDDVPWLPADQFRAVDTVNQRESEMWWGPQADQPWHRHGCIPRSAFTNGQVLLWRNRHLQSTTESPWAATILNAAAHLRVLFPRTEHRHSASHWINALGVDTQDLRFEVEPINPRGCADFELDGRMYNVRAVDSVKVRLWVAGNPASQTTIELPFLPVPILDSEGKAAISEGGDAYETDDSINGVSPGKTLDHDLDLSDSAIAHCVLYVNPRGVDSEACLRQLCRFETEGEHDDDEWLHEAIEQWDTVLGQIENLSLAHQTNVLLRDAAFRASLSDAQRGQLAVVAALPGGGPVALDVLGPAGLTELCQALAKAGAFGITPDTLHTALRGVVDRQLEQRYPAEFARQAQATSSSDNVADDGDEESQHDRPRGG